MRFQEAQFQGLVAIYQNAVLQADLEAENAIITLLNSQDRADNLQTSVEESALALRLVIGQYEEGNVDFNRYTVLQQSLIQQQDLWARARGDIARGLIDVYRARRRLANPPRPIAASLPAIAAAFLVSATIGIAFGFYPAWKASRMDPIEALRYEYAPAINRQPYAYGRRNTCESSPNQSRDRRESPPQNEVRARNAGDQNPDNQGDHSRHEQTIAPAQLAHRPRDWPSDAGAAIRHSADLLSNTRRTGRRQSGWRPSRGPPRY